MKPKIVGLIDCYNSPDFGPMNLHRNVSSTTFLGRYEFIDFPLSNFINSGIENIGILIENHIRSMTRHVTNGRGWMMNTKVGSFNILYDEQHVRVPSYNTDVSNLVENEWFLKQVNPDYVVIAPTAMVNVVDYRKVIADHIASGSRISMLYTHQKGCHKAFIGAKKIFLDARRKVKSIEKNQGDSDEADIAMGILVMDYPMLQSLVSYAEGTSCFFSIMDTLAYLSPSVLIQAVPYTGYVRYFDSLSHYLQYSLDILNEDVAKKILLPDWPIYTKTYDTQPAYYATASDVRKSLIANGSRIEGTVINSILGRDVFVKKGSVIKNCVIGSHAVFDRDTHIENAVIDKEAQVLHISEVIGTLDDPVYIGKGDIV